MSQTIETLHETSNVVLGATPAAAAIAGDYISLKEYRAVSAIILKAVGSAGNLPVVSMTQAKTAAGGGEKVLNIRQLSAKITTDVWQHLIKLSDTPAASYTFTGGGDKLIIAEIVIREQDLDINNGFQYVAVNGTFSSSGIQGLLYIPHGLTYKPQVNSPLA